MDEGFPDRTAAIGRRLDGAQAHRTTTHIKRLDPEPLACVQHTGPTPHHPEPGRETVLHRRYWRRSRWETRSVRQTSLARRGAVAARRAHNPKVVGSNPAAATSSTNPSRRNHRLEGFVRSL
jgi:hypothetical protein